MKKVATVIAIVLITAMILILIYGEKKASVSSNSLKKQVTVSTFALYDVSRYLLQDIADVSMLVPFGKDIHTFEPSPKDIIRLKQSRFFIFNGAGLEPWAEKYASNSKSIDMSRFVSLRELGANEGHHHDDEQAHQYDPHYWLDIDNMVAVTKKLTDLFEGAFGSEHKEEILKRSISYIKMLRTLDELYKKRLSSCHQHTIIVDHNAYGYLGARYGFEILSLTGMSTDATPNAKTVAHLSDIIHEKEIWTLFAEPFGNDQLIQSVAEAAQVRVDTLQPLANITEREEVDQHDYELIMQLNLKKLHVVLDCE